QRRLPPRSPTTSLTTGPRQSNPRIPRQASGRYRSRARRYNDRLGLVLPVKRSRSLGPAFPDTKTNRQPDRVSFLPPRRLPPLSPPIGTQPPAPHPKRLGVDNKGSARSATKPLPSS